MISSISSKYPWLSVLLLALSLTASGCHVSVGPDGVEVDDAPHIPIQDLLPGECIESFSAFEDPSPDGNVEAVVVSCEESHELEVTAVFDLSEAIDSHPGDLVVEYQAGAMCLEAFGDYAGIDAWDTNLISGQVYPLSSSWEQGDRQITCLTHHRDRSVLDGSVRGAGEALFADLGGRVGWQSLSTGECLNNIALIGYTGELSVTDCSKLHEAEVYYTEEITTFGDPYPGDETLRTYVREKCAEKAEDYIGGPVAEGEMDTSRFGPDAIGWDNGDRNMICMLTHAMPGTRYTGSMAADS